MQSQVDQMVGKRIKPPEGVLDPETGQDERVVDGGTTHPDLREAERSDDTGVCRQMIVVIPDESRMAERDVGQQDAYAKQ